MIVDIFIPCFIDQLHPHVGLNMVKILEKLGCGVNYNPEQTCCGQPAFNAGYWDEARQVGVKNYYPEMFTNSVLHNELKQVKKNMFEFSDFLVNVLKITNLGATLKGVATYHDSCAALREYGVKNEPRTLLSKVRGLEMREMKDTEVCCGFGGTFSAKFEPIAVGMVEQKVKNAMDVKADYIVSTDMSCLLHIDSYIKKQNLNMKVMHITDVLVSGWE
jgi:L-lactate dehydrogenase complex protein LldE